MKLEVRNRDLRAVSLSHAPRAEKQKAEKKGTEKPGAEKYGPGMKTFSRAVLVVLFSLWLFVPRAGAQTAQEREATPAPVEASYAYRFENARFPIPLIEINVAPDGSAALRFKRGESDDLIDLKLKLLPATLSRLNLLFETSRFITSGEDYQHKKDFAHMGWVTITMRQGASERTTRFNYTTHAEMKEVADIFRAIATQQIHLFDLDVAQQYQPLALPAQLNALENDLKQERVAEPEQMIAALREIAASDTLLTMARDQANRIIINIEKGKFKSPVKTKP